MGRDWRPEVLGAGPVALDALVGLPAYRLRAPHLQRPTRGVRSLARPETADEWISAMAPVLPVDGALSHGSACRVWDLPLPDAVAQDWTVDLMSVGETRVRRHGCRGHRGLETRSVELVRGLPVVGLADTWCDMGELVGSGVDVDDLVVLGDAVVARLDGRGGPHHGLPQREQRLRRSSPGLAELRTTLEGRVRPRGAVSLRRALDLVVPGVRSPMETRARVMFVRAGFPEPLANVPITRPDGSWLLEGDLVWWPQQVVGEYQGKDHAGIDRRSRDSARAADAGECGWTVLEIFAADVYRPPRRRQTLSRFAAALDLDPAALTID